MKLLLVNLLSAYGTNDAGDAGEVGVVLLILGLIFGDKGLILIFEVPPIFPVTFHWSSGPNCMQTAQKCSKKDKTDKNKNNNKTKLLYLFL